MDTYLNAQFTVFYILHWVFLVVAIVAFVNSLLYSGQSYDAANKLTKPAWCIILGVAVAVAWFGAAFFLLTVAAIVAPLVYLLDVRPALAGLYRR